MTDTVSSEDVNIIRVEYQQAARERLLTAMKSLTGLTEGSGAGRAVIDPTIEGNIAVAAFEKAGGGEVGKAAAEKAVQAAIENGYDGFDLAA